MSHSEKFSDLKTRVISAAIMLVVGVVALLLGGVWFQALLVIAGGLMAWETVRMHGVERNESLGIAAVFAIAIGLSFAGTTTPATACFALALTWVVMRVQRARFTNLIAFLVIFLACWALGVLRTEIGMIWTFWVIFCVIASDVGGYFAGRIFGGPKLWPAVSPKKTWSGTIGGWVLAVGVSIVFVLMGFQNWWLLPEAVLIAIFAQLGDLAESAMKRRAGIKDSSQLIPGHGGLLDRFDGLLGASIFMAILMVSGLGIAV